MGGPEGRHLRPRGERPASSARGLHHFALLSSDVERTIAFYQDLLEFPLVELFENRDYRGPPTSSSTSATATTWRTSTSPASTSGRTARCSGDCTTSRISVTPEQWRPARGQAGGGRASRPTSSTVPRPTFRDPTASGSSCSPTRSTTCTGRSSAERPDRTTVGEVTRTVTTATTATATTTATGTAGTARRRSRRSCRSGVGARPGDHHTPPWLGLCVDVGPAAVSGRAVSDRAMS